MRAPSSPARQYSVYTTAQTPSYFSGDLPHYPSIFNHPPPSAEKRQKLPEYDSAPGFICYDPPIDCSSLQYHSVPQLSSTRNLDLNPHISLQRASEPASPVTIATTLSAHSSPSPSPSRVTIMSSDHSPQEFPLYDDGMSTSAGHQKQQAGRRYDSGLQFSSPVPNSRFGNGFPTVVPQSDSRFSRPGSHYYPGNNDFSKAPSSQRHPQYLQTPSHQFGNQGMNMGRMLSTQNHASDDDDLPALSPHNQGQSRPSLSDTDLHSPSTPLASPDSSDGAEGCGASVPAVHIQTPTPKLCRTASDAFQDELFNPGIAPGTSIAAHSRQDPNGANSRLPAFIQQARTQHSMARATTQTTRDHSPFRANSPFHPAIVRANQFSLPRSPSRTTSLLPVGFGTPHAQREQGAGRGADLLDQQMQQGFAAHAEAPKTISPKDAFIDYCEPQEEGVKGSLFPQDDTYSQDGSVHSYKSPIHGGDDARSDRSFGIKTEGSFGSMATSRRESDVSMNFNSQLYGNGSQRYSTIGFYNYPQMDTQIDRPSEEGKSDTVSQNSAVEEEQDYDYDPSSPLSKPTESRADRGAYTCTVSGCAQRFPTTSKMSKHRREAHRQSTPLSGAKSHYQGPHKCTRVNPTTNKACNTVFSRPYDLTRHEDTIHNTDRQKVRCEICDDEKTFSRQDALTRHKKVKHGIEK